MAARERTPEETAAIAQKYLCVVQALCPKCEGDFLTVLAELRERRIDADTMLARVSSVFANHPKVLKGLHVLLSRGGLQRTQAQAQLSPKHLGTPVAEGSSERQYLCERGPGHSNGASADISTFGAGNSGDDHTSWRASPAPPATGALLPAQLGALTLEGGSSGAARAPRYCGSHPAPPNDCGETSEDVAASGGAVGCTEERRSAEAAKREGEGDPFAGMDAATKARAKKAAKKARQKAAKQEVARQKAAIARLPWSGKEAMAPQQLGSLVSEAQRMRAEGRVNIVLNLLVDYEMCKAHGRLLLPRSPSRIQSLLFTQLQVVLDEAKSTQQLRYTTVADFNCLLIAHKDGLIKKNADLEKRQRLLYTMCGRKTANKAQYDRIAADLESVNKLIGNVRRDGDILNEYVHFFKSSDLYDKVLRDIDEKCLMKPVTKKDYDRDGNVTTKTDFICVEKPDLEERSFADILKEEKKVMRREEKERERAEQQ